MLKPLKYYVGKEKSSTLKLHCEDCTSLPSPESRIFIGSFYTPNQAFSVASRRCTRLEYCPLCQDESKHFINDEDYLPFLRYDYSISLKKGQRILKAVRHSPAGSKKI
nr:MAG TPA: hypothetical protein [Caudoviricetes sp.]